jgi:hypothetical protein
MYTAESSLYRNVNHFLRFFPISIVSKFMNELKGILHYIYLLQSSIEYSSHTRPLTSDLSVYRGIKVSGSQFIPLYQSMIGEVIVWPSFTSTSTNQQYVINHFITGSDSILFKILLHPGNVAVHIENYSDYASESEVLIAASTGFMVESVESVDIVKEAENGMTQFTIPLVHLSYSLSWYAFDIEERPRKIRL